MRQCTRLCLQKVLFFFLNTYCEYKKSPWKFRITWQIHFETNKSNKSESKLSKNKNKTEESKLTLETNWNETKLKKGKKILITGKHKTKITGSAVLWVRKWYYSLITMLHSAQLLRWQPLWNMLCSIWAGSGACWSTY